ncbi:MAG TPA: hypothetical protein ENL38_01360, partial [Candidatus Aminicenantes bacterium]|nr:hypothetical protein [Candidatus Aminicenantes bacterium]
MKYTHLEKVDITQLKVVCLINPSAANRKWRRRRRLRRYLQNNLPGELIDTHQDKQFTIQTTAALSHQKD